MRLSFSNIAWDVAEDEEVAALLRRYGVDAIDIAPGKYFSDPARADSQGMHRVKSWWSDRGISIVGMQALLFGTTGLNVFGDENSRQALLAHLSSICRIGAGVGATRLVFGSPRNRDRAGLPDDQVHEIATDFFRKLGDIAIEHGVMVCLEPNPTHYGANFMVDSAETARVVQAVAHSAIRMQFDSGAILLNGEEAHDVLGRHHALVGHVHASDPDLVPLGDHGADHRHIGDTLARFLPGHLVTIEMVASRDEPHLAAMERALIYARSSYGPVAGSSA
nr:TIM barrel protein [Variovorax boronicumulans]